MPTSTFYTRSMSSMPALPYAWAAVSAEIVERLEEPILPELLARALGTLIPFEHCEQFVYRHEGGPIHIFDTSLNARAKDGLANYVKNTYVLNPFYKTYCIGLKTGVYRLRDLAARGPDGAENLRNYRVSATSSEEIGYLTDGWPPGRQELCIALEMPTGECAGITLARKSGELGFSAKEVASLSPVIPFLAVVFRRYWRHARFTHVRKAPRSNAEADIRGSGFSNLSPRECEIAQLLLRGHSTLSVSLRLGISSTTVKTHRKNLYGKLGIATQFELFSLFNDSLRMGSGVKEASSFGGMVKQEGPSQTLG